MKGLEKEKSGINKLFQLGLRRDFFFFNGSKENRKDSSEEREGNGRHCSSKELHSCQTIFGKVFGQVVSSSFRFSFLFFFFFGDEENLWQQTQVNDDDVTCGRHKPLNFKVFIFFSCSIPTNGVLISTRQNQRK